MGYPRVYLDVVVTRGGKPVLALTSIKGGDWETVALATNPKFMAIIERSRKSREPGLSTEEMRRRLGLGRRAG